MDGQFRLAALASSLNLETSWLRLSMQAYCAVKASHMTKPRAEGSLLTAPTNLLWNSLVPARPALTQGNAIGSGKRLTSTVNSCGICGGELKDTAHLGEEVRA